MIITKAGRRMFPTVKVRLSGLEPAASYIVFLDIVPVDDKRYRYVYHSSQWMVAGSGDLPLPHNLYVHPDSPATGQLWMAQGVIAFDKLKLTNNRKPLVRGQVSLHSMHKYLPRVHILQTTDLETPPEYQASLERGLTYTFPETTFTTVTAYQNQQITRLKIASNPFAKGFREASRTMDSLDDNQHLSPPEFSSTSSMGPSKLFPAEFYTLRPDTTFLPPSSSSLFLPEISSLDPYYNSSINNGTSALFHLNHNPYRCHPVPRHPPLTFPVKFVVPPITEDVFSDPTRRFCFEDISPHEITNKFTDDKQSKNICTDNYSRIISEDDNSRRYVSEFFQDVYLNSPSMKLPADSLRSTEIDDNYTNITAVKQAKKHLFENLPKIFKTNDKSQKFSPKDETSKKTQSNIQRFLVNPVASFVHHEQSCQTKESKSFPVYDLEQSPSKKKTSPLDLTKFK